MSYNTVIVQIRPDGRFEAWEPHGCEGLGTFKSMEDGVQDVTARYHYLGLKPLYQSNQVCVFEYGDHPAIQAKLAEVLEDAWKANLSIETLVDSLCRCKAEWARLKDWCIAGNGPGEMFRLQDSAKTATNHAEVFINYINSLWKEMARLKRCSFCDGKGTVTGNDKRIRHCPECEGTGQLKTDAYTKHCPTCGGGTTSPDAGQSYSICSTCDGSGKPKK